MKTTQDKNITFPVPLTTEINEIANKFSGYHKDTDKANQVRLNTIAVLSTKFYCDFLDIKADLNTASFNRGMQFFFDVADLNLTTLGTVECRYTLPDSTCCYIPEETWNNRIGYIVVEVNDLEKEATLLGFFKKVNQEVMPLEQLLSLEDFIDYIEGLEHRRDAISIVERALDLTSVLDKQEGIATDVKNLLLPREPSLVGVSMGGFMGNTSSEELESNSNEDDVDLVENLENILKEATDRNMIWAAAVRLAELNPEYPLAAQLKCNEILDLDPNNEEEFFLIVAAIPEKDKESERCVRIHLGCKTPQGVLPPGVKLAIFSESDELIEEKTSKSNGNNENLDNLLYLEVIGDLEEQISVKVTFNNYTFTKHLTIE